MNQSSTKLKEKVFKIFSKDENKRIELFDMKYTGLGISCKFHLKENAEHCEYDDGNDDDDFT